MKNKNETNLYNVNISGITLPKAYVARLLSHGNSQNIGAWFYVCHYIGA